MVLWLAQVIILAHKRACYQIHILNTFIKYCHSGGSSMKQHVSWHIEYCKSTNFGGYKIWRFSKIKWFTLIWRLSAARLCSVRSTYMLAATNISEKTQLAKFAKYNSTPKFVDLQYAMTNFNYEHHCTPNTSHVICKVLSRLSWYPTKQFSQPTTPWRHFTVLFFLCTVFNRLLFLGVRPIWTPVF